MQKKNIYRSYYIDLVKVTDYNRSNYSAFAKLLILNKCLV